MPTQGRVTIVLRRNVADEAQALAILNIVKAKLQDQPEVTVTGKYNAPLEPEE